ncbi:MAG: Rne/Rng family ribonuclease [Acidobacteriota bacterium]|nr:Rne/Rng family ribonuclease [Acidobacteriota bacterium]
MSKELIVSSTRHETRVAVLEDDQVVEIYYQREKEYSLAGSIHKGRVTRVLPGMQSAFVDIGLDRDAFLYVSDFFEDNEEYDKIVSTVEDSVLRLEKGGPVAVAFPTELSASVAPPPQLEPLVAPANPGSASAASPANSGQPRRDHPDAAGRDNRDGRGRRSRRRKPPGRGGLPDSKYASPRQGGFDSPKVDEPAPPTETASEQFSAPTEDFAVLPGESLAKYGAGEQHSPDSFEPVFIELPIEAEVQAEPAAQPEAEPALVMEVDDQPPIEALVGPSDPAEEPPLVDSGVELEAEAPNDGEEDSEITELDGPEPARIPASLTATLREQNPRYQHRVSRRMRRKMRGAPPNEEHRAPNLPSRAEAAPPLEARTPEPKVVAPPRIERERPPAPSISDLLREGQEIIVQIAKEPLGQKGARITSHIALPGRFLVYMPTVDHVGVSRKIPSDEERSRLKRVLQTHRTGIPGGYIVRTAGEGKSEEELRADMMFLYNLWLDMRQKAEERPAPTLMHHDLDLVERILRDQLTSAFKTVWVDNEEIYESVLSFAQRFQPALVGRIKLYTRPNPIFDEFGITGELEKALRPKVWLKSGGYIVINQTEALVAIDINTGKFVGKSNRLEDTIVKTNTDAIKEIVRQIRLRDLGGIIVVDFIDMDERKNRQKVMQALEESMRADRAPYKILQFNDFGLVAITRKRVKQSLERTLCSPCPYCEGAGYVKSVQTVLGEIVQEAQKIAKAVEGSDVMLRVNPEVAKVLKSNQNDYLQEVEQILGKNVLVKSDPTLHQTKFDLA